MLFPEAKCERVYRSREVSGTFPRPAAVQALIPLRTARCAPPALRHRERPSGAGPGSQLPRARAQGQGPALTWHCWFGYTALRGATRFSPSIRTVTHAFAYLSDLFVLDRELFQVPSSSHHGDLPSSLQPLPSPLVSIFPSHLPPSSLLCLQRCPWGQPGSRTARALDHWPTDFILYYQDKPQILCKGIGQPSPHLPFLPNTSCSGQTVLSCRSAVLETMVCCPLLGGPSKTG
ncbi:unnamed protein product, partial [Coccothraustes coccothraustes]